MTATNDGVELLWLTKRQKLCIVTNPPMRAPNNPEISVVFIYKHPTLWQNCSSSVLTARIELNEHSSSYQDLVEDGYILSSD